MPFQDIILVPGQNVEKTLELNQAGVSITQLCRYKSGLIQKLGGWTQFSPGPVSSTPVRDIHAFQGLVGNKIVASGSLTNLTVISSGTLLDITPQTTTSTPAPSFSVSSGSNIVTVHDVGSSAGPYQAVRFDTYVNVGGIVLSSAYAVFNAVDANDYTIAADTVANTTVTSSGILATFQTTAGSANVTVTLPSAQFQAIIGLYYPFRAPTSVGGLTIEGNYNVTSVIDSTSFMINAGNQATTSSGPVPMNGGNCSLFYYRTQGPPALAGAYGAGNYGSGAYGLGTPAGTGLGTPITATDWMLDNFGELLTAVPTGGPLYYWGPDTNFKTAQVVPTAPLFNIGGFVSQPQQIMFMYGSVQGTGTGTGMSGTQDQLLLRWSNGADFTDWQVTPITTAGSFRVPTGSTLIGAIQAPLFAVAWTDVDVWTATWAGQPLVWSFTRVGTGCGLIGQHAADVSGGAVWWVGSFNFYTMSANGVQVIPCPVWDFFFYQIDRTNQTKVRAASNSAFNEIAWYFPLSAQACATQGITYTGENNAYVKCHITAEGNYEWDTGFLPRTAWIDTTVVGPPMGTDNFGNIMQHETSFDAAGSAINAYFETGWFAIGDGSDLSIVDWCIPDMIWEAFGGDTTPGTVLLTFFAVDYPGATQRKYGAFAVTQQTPFITLRMRGRFCRIRVESNDAGTFWRLGRIKWRFGAAGRR